MTMDGVLPCPEHWSGSLSAFISTYTLANWFSRDQALRVHEDLLEYVQNGSVFFSRNLTGGRGPRGTRASGFPESYRLYGSDNAPALWLYTRLKCGKDLSVPRAIAQRQFPLRELFGPRLGEAGYEWSNEDPDPLDLRGRSPSGKRWKLCHLYSVASGLPDDLEWQKKRFLRLIHPFNLFLFPRPVRKGAGYYSIGNDLGEDFSVCHQVAERIRAEVGAGAWAEFLTAAGVGEDERPGRLSVLSTSAEFTLRYQEHEGSRSVRIPGRRGQPTTPPPQGMSAAANEWAGQVRLRTGSLVVRAKRGGDYDNRWDGSLLWELHTHTQIKNVIQRAAADGSPIFVQDQDSWPRRVTCFGYLQGIDACPDGTYRVRFERVEACDFPGSPKMPPGYYYAEGK